MHRIEILEKGIVKEIASCMEELSSSQYLYFVRLVLDLQDKAIDLPTFRFLLVWKLLEIKTDIKYHLLSKDEKENTLAEIARIAKLMDSFFKTENREGEDKMVMQLHTIHNFIPSIAGNLYGPQDGLLDISFCEYRTAHSFYRDYISTNNENDLNHLIAVLYRPRKRWMAIRKRFASFNGQYRVPFTAKTNPLLLEKRAKRIAKLPYAVRYGIFLFYNGCETFLSEGKPSIDGNEIDLSVLYSGSGSDTGSIGLVGLLYTLAETKVFGSIEQTDDQNLWDVMVRLYHVVMQMNSIKK